MIIVKLWGGIGNQLFQYVLGQYLYYKYGQEVRYDDNSYRITDKLRKRELDSLDIDIKYDNKCIFTLYSGIKGRLLRYFYQLNPKHIFIGLDEKLPDAFKMDHEYFLQAYWQDYKYYDALLSVNPDFKLVTKVFPKELVDLRQLISSTADSVSVHIRRGDYFKPEFVNIYGVCTDDYFLKAMTMIEEKVTDPSYFVFSDDLEWVKGNLHFNKNTVFIPNYDISQFAFIELMSLCKHHIISNSSFSWWGAVLNEQKDAIVISPSKWLLNTDKTIALDKWTKI